MFYICDKRENCTYGVKDTDDNVVEYYTARQIFDIIKKTNIIIDGVIVSGNNIKIKTINNINSYAILTDEIVRKISSRKQLRFLSNQENLGVLKSRLALIGKTFREISSDFILLEGDKEIILVSDKQIKLANCYKLFTDKFFFEYRLS